MQEEGEKMEKHVFENDTQSDTMDESHSIYIPSKSDSQSYREKIRKRFKLIKEHAGSVALYPKSLSSTIRHLKEENEQVRITFNKFIDSHGNYSKTDCYHFFCEETVNNGTSINESEEIAGSADNFEVVVQNLLPEVLQDFLELATANSLWVPARFLADFNLKSKDNICSLTEDGLYVPEQRKIPHISALEQRLALDDLKWFNCQGNLKLIESPISGRCYRPGYTDTNRYSTNFVVPKDASLEVQSNSISAHKYRIIQIHIFEIQFQHHSLFSIEHVIEKKLLQLFNSYKEKNDTNRLERISKKLDCLRKKLPNCGDAEIRKYSNEITKLRKLQINESLEHRALIKNILQVWRILKRIREDKHFANTNTKLLIYKKNADYETEVRYFEDNIKTITAEIIREQAEEYQEKLGKYKIELQIWSNDKTQKRPKKPINEINENKIRDNVKQDLMKAFKLPGEPIITFDINTENIITDKIENEFENLRRQAVRSTRIFVNILFNGIDVGRSTQINMNNTFRCMFNETFTLQIKDVAKNLIFQIYEQPSTMTERIIANLEVNISNITSKSKQYVQNFKKEEIIHYNHEGIGSGYNLKDICEKYNYPFIDDNELNTCGSINYSVSCKDDGGCYTDSAYSPTKMCANQLFCEEGRVDPSKLAQWTGRTEIDPQNPKNTVLFDYIDSYKKHQCDIEVSPMKYFRCNPEMNRLIFYDAAAVENNVRFQVLELRNNNEPEFAGMVVPNRLKEIPVNILSSYNKRIREEQIKYDFDERENIEARISKGQKYLKQLHIKIFQQCKSITSNLTYEDVVNEELLSYFQNYIKVLVLNFLNWFKLRPGVNKPLPQLATTKHDVNETVQNASTKLFISIVSAINIPNKINLRKTVKNRSSQNFEIMNVEPQHVYVTVSYDDMVLKTTVKEGSNPVWDEEMIFPLRATNIDYMSPNALNGSIVVNLFVNLTDKNKQQTGCNWLGFIKIPLSAVAQSSKMEGFFLLKSPVFLNYEQNLIYLNLKLKIQPQFPKLYLNMKELRSSEPPYLQDYLNKWNDDFNESCTQNNFSVLAVDSTGKTVCLTRFIRQLEPPQINSNDFDVTPEQCARFVSLIPFTECNKLYENMWLTTKELLSLMTGSATDHSIALTCFFLALNMEAWLLLGYGIPCGATAYVLTREYNNNNVPVHYVYDSSSAFKYRITDPLCPLQRVFCVVNETNIWANVQRTNDIALLQFDFTRRSDWHSVFTNQMPAPTNSMQHKLGYYSCGNGILQDLQFQTEKKLRKAILKYRRTEKTTWNHYISNQLKMYISNIEHNYTCNRFDISHLKGIEHLESIYGFVMNLPYTNIGTLLDTIRVSQIFDIGGTEKEYLFGIHFHGYPNHVIVVWMIIGFILPNK